MKTFTMVLLLLVSLTWISAKDDPFSINRELGRGMNLGNMFEAPSETAWSNPYQSEYVPMIAERGFSHVRIPIRWETEERSMDSPPYTIYPEFLNRIKGVVDQATDEGLYAIINMHHHNAMLSDPVGQKSRFLAQWAQISEFFSDYPDTLLFEIFNEPNGDFTAELWNEYLAEALSVIRETNPSRLVLIGTAEWGGLGGLSKLVLPEDERLILTIHYYSPFQFTHQGASWVSSGDANEWLGTQWNGTQAERDAVHADFKPLIAFREKHNIPVHIGEFGAYSRADLESRTRWTTFLTRTFEDMDFSWAYWEFSAGFGIYDRSSGDWIQPLVDALLNNEIPELIR